MVFIQDAQLYRYYHRFEQQHEANPTLHITEDNILDMLQTMADTPNKSMARARAELQAATREARLAIVKAGINAFEKRDIARILDTPEAQRVPMDESVRNFLAAVLDREPLRPIGGGGGNGGGGNGGGGNVGNDDLKILGDQHDGILGKAHAGDIIEAINLTSAPPQRLHIDDVVEIARAGADGSFRGNFLGQLNPTHEGDYIRLRARNAVTGKTSDWVTIQADGLALSDTDNAQIAVFRISVSSDGNHGINVANLNEGRQISEPFAKVCFKNRRNGQGQVVTLDADGTFPKGTKISGEKGDIFDIAVSDGVNNKSFSQNSGQVVVPGGNGGGGGGNVHVIPEPALAKDELDAAGNPLYQEVEFHGPVFPAGEPEYKDVKQGQLGDCYCPSAFAAMALAVPEMIKKALRKNDDGTYTAFFKHKNWQTGQYETVEIGPMSGKLYVRPNEGPLYGAGGNVPLGPEDVERMDLWFPLLEKAYACWKGSYEAIGHGGSSAQVFQDVMGVDARTESISDDAAGGRELFQWVKHAIDSKLPASLGTYGDSEKLRYTGSGIYPDHSYSVLGYKEENGKQYLKLRNPWGEQVPPPDLGSGVFWIEASKAAHYYETFFSVKG